MGRVIVQYRVKPDQAATNEALIREVYEELKLTEPAGLRYATFKLDDGVSFVHIASVETHGDNPLSRVAAFQRFQEGIKDRCEEAPRAVPMTEVGSFRLFGEESPGD